MGKCRGMATANAAAARKTLVPEGETKERENNREKEEAAKNALKGSSHHSYFCVHALHGS